jgi:predicted porin
MTLRVRAVFVAIAGLTGVGSGLAAQSVQRFSVQGSGSVLHATSRDPSYVPRTRFAYEAQVRYTFGRFSLGAGYQRDAFYPSNTKLHSLLFLEPRYVAAAGSGAALYLAGRVGIGALVCRQDSPCGTQTSDATYGGGLGVLLRLNRSISADIGAQLLQVTSNLSSAYVMAQLGLTIGL